MKKLMYTLLIVFACMVSITACTEEEIAPSTNNGGDNGGTYSIDEVKRK